MHDHPHISFHYVFGTPPLQVTLTLRPHPCCILSAPTGVTVLSGVK